MEKTDNNQLIDKLALIHIKDGKVLVTLSKGKDVWYIPGGKREKGESDEIALAREIKEELSVDVDTLSMQLYGIFRAQAHGKPEGTTVQMTCYTALFNGILTPNSEIEKLDFFTHEQKHLTAAVDHLIFDDLKLKGLLS